MKKMLKYSLIPLIFLIAGCDYIDSLVDEDPVYAPAPECEVTRVEKINSSSFPKFKITVENTSGTTAYYITATIKFKLGNTIVDDGFLNLGTLDPGEAISDAVWLSKVYSHSDYDNYKITLMWQDCDGYSYSAEYF